MAAYILVVFVLMMLSIHSAFFLIIYYQLTKFGVRGKGEIVSYEPTRYLLLRNVSVPKVSFLTEAGFTIIKKPAHSYFISINAPNLYSKVITYYKQDNPEYFVIQNKAEVIVNSLIIVVTICGILWLFI